MFAKIFSPTISYRLFDPMPLPRIFRIHRRIRSSKSGFKIAVRTATFNKKIKKIPMYK